MVTEPGTAPEEPHTPVCFSCRVPLVQRDERIPTLAALGTWWDHPPLPTPGFVGHTTSALDPSPGMRSQLIEQARRSAGHVQPPLPVSLA